MIPRRIRISESISIFIFLLLQLFSTASCHRRHHTQRSISENRFLGFEFQQEPVGGIYGDSILLHCQYLIGNQDVNPVLEWKRDGSLVKPRADEISILANGSLLISKPQSSHEGSYQCVVHVKDSSDFTWTFLSRRALVQLESLPKFALQPSDREVAKGQPAVFHCLAPTNSSNPVKVTWFQGDKEVVSGGDYLILPLSNSLEISSAQPRHEGDYKCVAEGAGKRRTSQAGKLRVLSSSKKGTPTELLEFLSEPRPQTIVEGEDVILECLATGISRPEVRWLKDSRQVSLDGTRLRRVGVSSLLIRGSSVEDAGLYTCRASNNEDSKDRTVALRVNVLPHITTRPTNKISIETADVEFECAASGRPLPSITWAKNGEKIVASEYFVIEANRLRILGLVKTDQGVYQCIASNDLGTSQAAAQLLVDSPDSSSIAASSGQPLTPSAPLGLKTVTIGSRVISLEWDAPVQRHGNILRYHVLYKEENIDRERMANFSSSSGTLTGLQPDTLYIVRVAAENEAGMGKMSDHIKITTKREQAVPGKVVNLRATALSSETVEVKWDPPPTGPVALRYKLFYIRNPPGDELETQTITTATSYTFHGMEKYTEYLIRVEADGENGSGLSSDVVSVRTHSDIPREPPRDIVVEPVSSTSVRVSWKEPLEGVNGDITGYRVRYKTKQRGNNKGNTFVIDANEREYTITDLEKDTQYLVKVAVVNHNGTGEYSDWLHVTTPSLDKEETLLGAPRELRPQAGADFIMLSWLPPADESVLVREYQIGWGHNVPDVHTTRVSGNMLDYKITGLKSGRDYVVSLRGSNRHGLGFPIYETVRTLSPSSVHFPPPSFSDTVLTPVGVRAETQSATTMRISWTDPDPNSFNALYTVRYSSGLDNNQMRSVNSSDPWATIEGLRPATEYEFVVRTITNEGTLSPWSMAARNRTLPAAPSSAPRDLTVLPASSGDPHSVSLNWQPPKYSNGEIEEYLIYYTDRPSLSDKDWTINYVSGDRLSHHVNNLLPKVAYHFKIQARNEKGYGPLSSVQKYVPIGAGSQNVRRPASDETPLTDALSVIINNKMYLVIVIATAILFIFCVVWVTLCVTRSSSKNKRAANTSARKRSVGGDLWINQSSGSHMRGAPSDYMVDGMATALTDRLTGPEVVESPPPRYQALQGPGTLSRNYMASSGSLEARQRTPQVVYTGNGKHQPIAKIDYDDSPYGSSSHINSATPPIPQTQVPGPPMMDGYRTLNRATPPGNPLRSFTQLSGPPPPRAVVTANMKQLPVGRATAQPRVNVANVIYSPYASCSSDPDLEKKAIGNDIEMLPTGESDLQPSNSAEDLTEQRQNLDAMIDDLQKFQHELNETAGPLH